MGLRCHFAHGREELRGINDPIPQSTVNMLTMSASGTGPFSNYKTVKCKNYETGMCKYGESCSFAHGDTDIKPPGTTLNSSAMSYYNQLQQSVVMQELNSKITFIQLQALLGYLESEKSSLANPVIDLLEANNVSSCATVLNEIVYRADASDDEKLIYTKILSEVQQLGTTYYNSYMQQLQQQQLMQTYSNNMMV